MKIFCVLVFAIVLTGCAPSTAPTAAPAQPSVALPSASAPPAAPTSSRPTNAPLVLPTNTSAALATTAPKTPQPGSPAPSNSLDVANVKSNKQSNGDITTSASISTQQNLGVGQIDLSYPETMLVGESRTVHLRLSPAQQLVLSSKETPKKNIPNAPNFVFKFSGNVDLYPVMNAQLIALGFDVNPSTRVQQLVDTASPANWSWVIKAKEPGRQELALTISIPAVVGGADSELSKNLQDLAIAIQVAPQPVSLTNQIMQSIANNSGAIVVALIGLFGTILGIIIKLRSDKDSKKRS